MTAVQLEHVAIFTQVDTDEDGDARVVTRTLADVVEDARLTPRAEHIPRLRILAVYDEPPALRRRLFAANPFCCECGDRIEGAEVGGVVPTDEGPRLAHRNRRCYGAAIAKRQPDVAIRAALGRIAPRGLRA